MPINHRTSGNGASLGARCHGIGLAGVVLLMTAAGCSMLGDASLKLTNATSFPAVATKVLINGESQDVSGISVPARSAQKYSPEGHIGRKVVVGGGELLEVTFHVQGRSVRSECVVPKRPEGICLLRASFWGNSVLICGFDCDTGSSR